MRLFTNKYRITPKWSSYHSHYQFSVQCKPWWSPIWFQIEGCIGEKKTAIWWLKEHLTLYSIDEDGDLCEDDTLLRAYGIDGLEEDPPSARNKPPLA